MSQLVVQPWGGRDLRPTFQQVLPTEAVSDIPLAPSQNDPLSQQFMFRNHLNHLGLKKGGSHGVCFVPLGGATGIPMS